MDFNALIEKYPQLTDALENARALQESSGSMMGKSSYKEKQSQINSLIPELIETAKDWNENKLRHIIVKMEILRDEIIAIERNSHALDILVEQINRGEFDTRSNDDE